MDDIFTQCREGNAVAVRLWLDNTENDLNQGWAVVYHIFINEESFNGAFWAPVLALHLDPELTNDD